MTDLVIAELELADLYRLIKSPKELATKEVAAIYRAILEKNFGTQAAQNMILEINENDDSIIKSFEHLGITKSLLVQDNLPQTVKVTAKAE